MFDVRASYRQPVVQLLLLAVAACAIRYAFSALAPLQEALQKSFMLSDNETALLQGLAVAMPIALGSIPFGLLADQVSRKKILIACLMLALFSCVWTAIATNFAQVVVARCLMGLSVPGAMVAVYSIASDLSPPGARGRSTMLVTIGECGGAPLAFALGGLFLIDAEHYGLGPVSGTWNKALLWMTIVLIPVLCAMFLLQEPARTERVSGQLPVSQAWAGLWRYRATMLPLQMGRAIVCIADGAVVVWGAPLFSRRFHLSADRIGATLGALLLIGGLLGPLIGGPLADYCQRRGGPRYAIRMLTALTIITAPLGLFALMPNASTASLVLGSFLVLSFAAGTIAMTLILVVIPGELRGLSLGINIIVGSIFFVGLAPLAVSALSGVFTLSESLATVCSTACVTNAVIFAASARRFPVLGNATMSAPA